MEGSVREKNFKYVTNRMFIILYSTYYRFNLSFNSKNDINIYAHNQNKLWVCISFLEMRTKLLSTHGIVYP